MVAVGVAVVVAVYLALCLLLGNEAILRDSRFLNSTTSKTRFSSVVELENVKNETTVGENSSVFDVDCHEEVRPGHTGCAAPVTQNHLSKPEDPMLQNATF